MLGLELKFHVSLCLELKREPQSRENRYNNYNYYIYALLSDHISVKCNGRV